MASAKDLVNPNGNPLINVPNLIVVKLPQGTTLPRQLMETISKVTHCAIIELPMDSELIMGEVAQNEMDSVHHALHAINELPDINFNKKELSILYSAMRYLCEKTSPGEASVEVILLQRIKKFTV